MSGPKSDFATLVAEGQSTGEVVAVQRFIVRVSGLETAVIGAVILFENGEHGFVRSIRDGQVLVLTLLSEGVPLGTLAVVKSSELMIPAGRKLLGRMVNPLMHPLDGKGVVLTKTLRPVFKSAPGFAERAILETQLETGVTLIDTLFPIVLGQRIALMGDAKSGKTTFFVQAVINQARQGRAIVIVLIAKRRTDVEQLIARFKQAGVSDKITLVVADVFDSVVLQWLAPYAGCALAEELWEAGEDTVIVYDDFSSHAKLHREISLLTGTNPGRESFPGDMFYTHSSLLERAGKLKSNNKTLTALPVAVTPNDDITGYLSTSLISMTDGQIVFDLNTMHQGARPAVNVGLSVSRVGGRAQSQEHKELASEVGKILARSRQAEQFSHFGTELSPAMRKDLFTSTLFKSLFNQAPDELFTLREQQIMLHAVLQGQSQANFSIHWLKSVIRDVASPSKTKLTPEQLAVQLLSSKPEVHA